MVVPFPGINLTKGHSQELIVDILLNSNHITLNLNTPADPSLNQHNSLLYQTSSQLQ